MGRVNPHSSATNEHLLKCSQRTFKITPSETKTSKLEMGILQDFLLRSPVTPFKASSNK